MGTHVTPFLNRVNISKSFCSFNVGLNNAIYDASKLRLTLQFLEAIHFLKKFHRFTKDRFDVAIKWKTKQVKSLFPLKDKNIHPSCVVYKGTCSCGETYIGETKRNASVRWEEHNNPTKNSEPAKHLKSNIDHVFNWVILCMASKNCKVRRNLEASYIALLRPTLNEQKDFEILTLFRNGVT